MMEQFFGAYFHEDWAFESDNPDDQVRIYMSEAHRNFGDLLSLANEIENFVISHNEEYLSTALFRELGCYYHPGADGLTTKEWLMHVVKMLRESRARNASC